MKILDSISNCFGCGINTEELAENLLAPRYNPLQPVDPKSYVQDVEQYFKRDPVAIYQHLETEAPEAQRALLLHSDLLRKHLNLKDPNGFKYKYLPSSPVPPIQPHLAPKAFALAVTLLTQAAPEKAALALTRFDELLQKQPLNWQSVEEAILHLLAQFPHLATDHARTTIDLIGKHFQNLPIEAQGKIHAAAQPLMENPVISEEMKQRLNNAAPKPSPFYKLPAELRTRILGEIHEDALQNARAQGHLSEQYFAEVSTSAMANPRLVSRLFYRTANTVTDKHPDIQTTVNRNRLDSFVVMCTTGTHSAQRPDKKRFREMVVDLIARPVHFDIRLSSLDMPDALWKILLEELSRDTTRNLRNIKFHMNAISDLNNEILKAAEKMHLHNPDLNLILSLAIEGEYAKKAILTAKPSTLDLSLNHQLSDETYGWIANELKNGRHHMKTLILPNITNEHRELGIIADALPQSGLTACPLTAHRRRSQL